MNWNPSNIENLRRVFTEGFTARDIAEPLISLDAGTPASEALQLMQARDFDVLGVRRNGLVAGFLERVKLGEGTCGQHLQTFDDAVVLSDAVSLADAVVVLVQTPRLFIKTLGAVGGIITMSDIQKPPVRMWLFGIITIMEMRISRLIEVMCPEESWKKYLSEARLEKAMALREERRRRNQDVELLDCLQISDKGQIVARNENIRNLTVMESRRQMEEGVKRLESLRNNLAHSQDILASDWDTIVGLCGDLERTISGTEEIQRALEKT